MGRQMPTMLGGWVQHPGYVWKRPAEAGCTPAKAGFWLGVSMLKNGRWARDWECCHGCGTTERPHCAKGLCKRCYKKERYHSAENQCIDCGEDISPRATRCHSCVSTMHWKAGVFDDRVTEELRHKLSSAMKRRWDNGDFEDIRTEEWRRKLSESIKRAWGRGCYGDEYRKKQAGVMRQRWERGDFDDMFDEELRQRISEAVKAAWVRGDFDGEETRRRMSEASKAAWARGDMDGVFDNEETRRKMSEGVGAAYARGAYDGNSEAIRAAHARGAYGEEWRRKKSEAMKAAWANGTYDGVFQSPTSIELQVAAALDIMGIEHETQYRPDGYSRIYDVFIPPNTLMEIQGDYWHGPERPEQQKRDAEKAQWAEEHGFEFIEIWEHEIKDQGAWVLIALIFA